MSFDSAAGQGKQTCDPQDYVKPPSKNQKDLEVQLILSLVLGISALLVFCILRSRWPAIYSARKRRLDATVGSPAPALATSFFGWIPGLYKVTEEQVLSSAGLDAFVFLTFFKMATRLFCTMSFFAVVILWPLNYHYRHFQPSLGSGKPADRDDGHDVPDDKSRERAYLWAYVVFTYFFTGLALYSLNWETFRIIQLRQQYLGLQSTVTDRTFRLTSIPPGYRSEAEVRSVIERLDIGRVTSVTLCRRWKELDRLIQYRDQTMRRLEAAWAQYLRNRGADTEAYAQHQASQDEGDVESAGDTTRLLAGSERRPHVFEGDRPQVTLRYGLLRLRSRRVDAIDYYEEKLRRIDEQVAEARKKDYEPTDMALVTMDSVRSCMMLIQARIDARPGCFLTKTTPSPSDLVWKNTYARRGVRRLMSWSITLFITVLTLLWIFPTALLASWLSICTIKRVLPALAHWLSRHPILQTLFQNGLPTLVVSLLNVAVPYLYDWLSNHQGMISQGDVELSVISKNFFFTFFNTFFVFAVSRTGFDFWSALQEMLKDTSKIPAAIAADVEDLSIFYISFIMLQGIGLMPFRILEVGSVLLYPAYRLMSKTPRDFAELRKPPIFQYGFYLPTALLVFNLCLIYSVLMWGFAILIFGTIYFAVGYLTYKYMVLYAMDQPQHATGGAWRIICYRIVIGLLVFEVVMVGQIASLSAFVQSVAVLPLIPFTVWYSYYFKRRFEPLTRYIALRAIRKPRDRGNGAGEAVIDDDASESESGSGFDSAPPRRARVPIRRGSTLDEVREKGLVFVNPSLVVGLQQPWIYKDPPPCEPSSLDDDDSESAQPRPTVVLPDADSSLGIGDDNVWLENGRRGRRSG